MITEFRDLTQGEYKRVAKLVYAKSGINLGDQKIQLVRARLGKRVRQGGFKSFRAYLEHVERDTTGQELCQLLDSISTNTTHLFREMRHFLFLRQLLEQWLEDRTWRTANSALRIWSAGCSSGEEPFTLAMVAHAVLQDYPSVELKILATDLSIQMLSQAKLGLYEPHRVGTVPAEHKRRYLAKIQDDGRPMLQIVPELRRCIKFARFNLMTPKFPFSHGFHIIFCRNVMIYFDRETQRNLVNKFTGQLKSGGHLMIGHSESLNGIDHTLSYVEPTVYRKA